MAKTLYPPQVNTFMPAFVYTDDAVVYYSLSPYNEISKIKKVHISLVDSTTNQNALIDSSGIILSDLIYDEQVGLYKAVIPVTSLYGEKEYFKINQFYKVQLRFDTCEKSAEDNPGYFINNREYFSEWSNVCLIRAIHQPTITLRVFSESDKPSFNKGVIPIYGSLSFETTIQDGATETDVLQSFRILVMDESGATTYIDSGCVYPSGNVIGATNDINYRVDVAGLPIDNGTMMTLRVMYVTKNQHEGFVDYPFQIVEYIEDEFFNPVIKAVENIDDGSIKVTVKNPESVFGILHIKRSSNHTHYREWETVYSTKVAGPVDLEIVDNTVASTDWYRYSAQLENKKGGLSPLYQTEKVIVDFHDMILSRGSKQLAVRYNYIISSFKPTVNRAKIDTLGGKYPKFAENAQMNYKQFSISGLMTAEADFTEKFMAKTDFFNAPERRTYKIYKEQRGVQEHYDYLWEREFREEAIKWLNDGLPKLYRSQTEGNMVVMITDVSLTPNKTVARLIWDFTATVYEIEDGYDMSVLHELGIYNIYADGKGGDGSNVGSSNSLGFADSDQFVTTLERVGQKRFYTVTEDSLNFVTDVVGKDIKDSYVGILKLKTPVNFKFRNVKIFFHSKPSVYVMNQNGAAQRIDLYGENNLEDSFNDSTSFYGYCFDVNGEHIFVSPDGYYQIPNDIEVTSIVFNKDDEVSVEYIVSYQETVDDSKIVRIMSVDKTVVGQIGGYFQPYDYLLNNIGNKYKYKSSNYFTELHALKGICVDVQPYSVVSVKYTDENEYNEYLVGMGGVLHLLDDGYSIKDFCFVGRKMVCHSDRDGYYMEPWEYMVSEESFGSVYDVKYPVVNTVYRIGNGFKIYHFDGKWYNFRPQDENTGIAEVPVEGVVNYYCDVLRGEY